VKRNTRLNEEALDLKLASDSQLMVAKLVKDLPQDQVDLVWRSNLNEKLRVAASAAARRRLVTNWVLRPALGLSLAGAVFLVVLSGPRTSAPPTRQVGGPGIEAALVNAYHADSVTDEVSPAEPAQNVNADSTYDPYSVDNPNGI